MAIFKSITLSTDIDEGDKELLYLLYRGNLCKALQEAVPFCTLYNPLTLEEFALKFGSFDPVDNNAETVSKGIINFVSQLQQLLQNSYTVEIQEHRYV